MPIIVIEKDDGDCIQVSRQGEIIIIKTHSLEIASEVERKVIDALKGQNVGDS